MIYYIGMHNKLTIISLLADVFIKSVLDQCKQPVAAGEIHPLFQKAAVVHQKAVCKPPNKTEEEKKKKRILATCLSFGEAKFMYNSMTYTATSHLTWMLRCLH